MELKFGTFIEFYSKAHIQKVAWIISDKAFKNNGCSFFYTLALSHHVLQAVTISLNISLACLFKISSKFHVEPSLLKSIKIPKTILLGFATGFSYFKSESAPLLQSEGWQEEDSTSAKWQEDAGT